MADSWHEGAPEIKRENIRRDHDGLNNEASWRDKARIKRAISSKHTDSKKTNNDDDNGFMEFASQILITRQQQQIDRLNHQFALYDQATTLALAEIDQEIALAEQEYQLIQDNATVLADGSRVYRDNENGHFYDETDRRISQSGEIEAISKHERNDSSRQEIKHGKNWMDALHTERKDIVNFQNKQNELKQRLESSPQDAAEIRDELDNMPAPQRVQKEIRSENSTSFAKEVSEGGIQAKNALRPAFTHASRVEQVSTEPAPGPQPNSVSPQSNPGMTMG